MKKFLLIIFICITCILPTFAAAWQIQEARSFYAKGQYEKALESITNAINSSSNNDAEAYKLRIDIYKKLNNDKYIQNIIDDLQILVKITNKTSLYEDIGYLNLKTRNYRQAFYAFGNSIDKRYPKSTINANSGFIKIAQDSNAPLESRLLALDMISHIYKINHKYNDYLAANMKMFQLIALEPENSSAFKKMPKKDVLNGMREKALNYANEKDSDAIMGGEFAMGLFEYSIGNKELGIKIVNGVINESISRSNMSIVNELRSTFNYVKQVLDNGLPDNTLINNSSN